MWRNYSGSIRLRKSDLMYDVEERDKAIKDQIEAAVKYLNEVVKPDVFKRFGVDLKIDLFGEIFKSKKGENKVCGHWTP